MRVKNIFFLILLFISGNVFGQSWNTITGKSSYTDSARYLKYKGVNNFDSVLYIHPTTGMLLKTVKGLTPSIGVDSITLYFNQLCQWSGGIPTCYFLQPSTFGANDSLHLNFDSTWILHYSNGTLLSDSIYLIHTVLYTDNHFALSPYLAPYTQLLEATRLVDSVYASPFGTSFNYIKYATGHIDSLAAGSGGGSSGLDSTYISSDSLYQIFIYASGRIDSVQWVGDGSAGGGGDGVDSIWRTLGQDSIKFSINGRLRSIKDSTGGGATITASNGLTKVVNDIQLGGALTGNTNIDARNGNYIITIQGDAGNTQPLFQTIGGQQGGIFEGSNIGLSTESALTPLTATSTSTSMSSVVSGLYLQRGGLLNGAVGNGLAISISLLNNINVGVTGAILETSMTNVTSGAEVSKFEIFLANITAQRKFSLAGNGQLTLDGYSSSGFYSGDTSANKPLVVNSSGVISQGYWASSSGGGGTALANFYLKDSSLSSNRSVTMNGKTLGFIDGFANEILTLDPVSFRSQLLATDNTATAILELNAGNSGFPFLHLAISDGSNLVDITADPVANTMTYGAATHIFNGNITLGIAGNKFNITTGSNASIGTATLSSGTVTVSTTAVSSSSLIFVTYDTPSGTLASGLSTPTGSIVNATSFVINSLTTAGVVNTFDNSTVRWWVIN